MSYLQLDFEFEQPQSDPEILMAYLGELGYESFVTHDNDLTAYIYKGDFSQILLRNLLDEEVAGFKAKYELKELPDVNWNAVWESNFPSVEIAGKCRVRAPFHEPDPNFPLEIIIEPKMSFGTAHHETTALMMELLLDYPPKDLDVLDMGCGTGILAILASRLGAKHVVAIDNEEWAYRNALENVARNECSNINVTQGDASLLGNESFDLILANINRNILLNDIPVYASVLKPGGRLILSGFYKTDLAVIKQEAMKHSLKSDRYLMRNEWVAAEYLRSKD